MTINYIIHRNAGVWSIKRQQRPTWAFEDLFPSECIWLVPGTWVD